MKKLLILGLVALVGCNPVPERKSVESYGAGITVQKITVDGHQWMVFRDGDGGFAVALNPEDEVYIEYD